MVDFLKLNSTSKKIIKETSILSGLKMKMERAVS